MRLAARPRPLAHRRPVGRAPCAALRVTTAPTAGGASPDPAAAAAAPLTLTLPSAPLPVADCAVGPDLWALAAATGAAKAALPLPRVLALGTLAGVFIGYGASLALSVGGNLTGIVSPAVQRFIFGAYGFPMGLLAIAVLGGELFTGNAFLFTAALAERKTTLRPVLTRAAAAWASNFAGVAAVALLLSVGPAPPAAAPAAAAAAAKATLPLSVMLARGVLCNVAVCVAVLSAASSRSLAGKALGIWFPLSCFATLGFEHVVANMFIFALAAAQGAGPALAGVATNLAVVTVGNVVGAAVVLGGLMRAGYSHAA